MHGGRTVAEGREAVAWAREAVERGAGEILLTSMDRDGTTAGYDLELTRAVADAVGVPVIASGGVGELEHLVEGVIEGGADAVLCASIFHYGKLHGPARPRSTCARPASRCGSRSRPPRRSRPSRPSPPPSSRPDAPAVAFLAARFGALLGLGLRAEGTELRLAGEVELFAVGDHGVVLAELVAEDLVAVAAL